MKTTKIFLMAALALTFAACSNDDNDIQTTSQPAKAEGITITATLAPKDAGATTRAVSEGTGEDAGNIVASWAAKEHIAILYEKDGTKYAADAEIKSVDASGTATIEFTVESGTADNTECKIVYPYSAAKDDKSDVKDAATLLASQDGTLSANLDVRVGAGKIKTSTPSLTVTTEPAAQFAIFKFTTKNSDASADISISSLTVTILAQEYVITPGSTTSELFVALPAATYQPVIFSATGSDSKSYTCSKYPVTFAGGKYYQSTLKMQEGTTVMWFPPFMGDDMHMLMGEGYTYNDVTLKGNGIMRIDPMAGMNFMDNGDCTFNVPDGKKFKSIVISGFLNGFSGTGWSKVGELGDQTGTWTGDSKSVGFNVSGNSQIYLILFTVN